MPTSILPHHSTIISCRCIQKYIIVFFYRSTNTLLRSDKTDILFTIQAMIILSFHLMKIILSHFLSQSFVQIEFLKGIKPIIQSFCQKAIFTLFHQRDIDPHRRSDDRLFTRHILHQLKPTLPPTPGIIMKRHNTHIESQHIFDLLLFRPGYDIEMASFNILLGEQSRIETH